MITNKDIFHFLEKWAPKHLAYDWDPVGLQVGSEDAECKKIMVTLDVLDSVVDEAIENNIDLIVAHHPLVFSPLKQIDLNTPKGRIIEKLIKHNITVYAAHTNLDIADGGVNDLLAEALQLKDTEVLVETKKERLYKFVVFVPETHENQVRTAIGEAGAGYIGSYSHCAFSSKGTGTFQPLEGAKPFIGTKDKLEFVEEVRIETIVSEANRETAIQAAQIAHPYEEMAYDIYPLTNQGNSIGIGRVGYLERPSSLSIFIEQLKKALDVEYVRLTGQTDKQIEKIAVLGGSGEKYYKAALKKGADVYVTGDVTFHQAQDAEAEGLIVIDAGHYIEKIIKHGLFNYLQGFSSSKLEVIQSNVDTDPFQYV